MKNEAIQILKGTLIIGISTGLGYMIGDTLQKSKIKCN